MFLKFIEMFFLAMFTKLFVATFYKSNTRNLGFKTDLFFQNDSKGVGKGKKKIQRSSQSCRYASSFGFFRLFKSFALGLGFVVDGKQFASVGK